MKSCQTFRGGRMIGLKEAGCLNRQIGQHIGWSNIVFAHCWNQWLSESKVSHHRSSRYSRAINVQDDCTIRRTAMYAPILMISIQHYLATHRDSKLSRDTICIRQISMSIKMVYQWHSIISSDILYGAALSQDRQSPIGEMGSSVTNPTFLSILMTATYMSGDWEVNCPIYHLLLSDI